MVVAEFHRRVDILNTGYSLFKHPHRFKAKRHAQTTRRKTRNVLHDDRFFAHLTTNIRDCLYRLVAGLFPNHNFKEPHDVHRIEKVHTNNSFGRFEELAISEMDSDDVLLAKMKGWSDADSTCLSTSCFSSSCSGAASMIRSAAAQSIRFIVP